jgi:Helix-turn-helix domain
MKLSDLPGTITCVSHGAVRVRLDVTDVQAGMLLRAAGARRFAWNWAVATIRANVDQWAAEASYDIEKPDRVRPLTFFTLAKLWTAAKPDVCPWAGEHFTWTFRYALRDAVNAHAAFLAGTRRFPGSSRSTGTGPGSPSATAWPWRPAGCGSRSTAGCASPRLARRRRSCGGCCTASMQRCSTSPSPGTPTAAGTPRSTTPARRAPRSSSAPLRPDQLSGWTAG